MLKTIFLLLFAVFLFSGYSFAQTDRSNQSYQKELVPSDKVDYNMTVNPSLDLAVESDSEQANKELISLNAVIANSTKEDASNNDKSEDVEVAKTPQPFSEVINPQSR